MRDRKDTGRDENWRSRVDIPVAARTPTRPPSDASSKPGGVATGTLPEAADARRAERPGPIPSLDGLRAVAVLVVVVSHSGFGDVIPGGLGVTIFFFLSGYLITTLLLDESNAVGQINVGHFYLRRAYRLLPPLFVTLLVAYSLVGLGMLGGGTSVGGLSSQVFYFANYYSIFLDPGDGIPAGTGILWSLAVEEHFYIVYPVVMVVALRFSRARRGLIAGFTALCVLALLWRIWLVTRSDFNQLRTYYATDTRFDSILFGCLLALCKNPARLTTNHNRTTMRPIDWAWLGGGVVLLLTTLVYRDPEFRETFRYSVQGLALMPVFYYAVRFPTTGPFRLLNMSWVARVGVLSYGIYLIHHVILFAVGETIDLTIPPVGRLAIALTGSLMFAGALDRWVDPYFRRRRAALH